MTNLFHNSFLRYQKYQNLDKHLNFTNSTCYVNIYFISRHGILVFNIFDPIFNLHIFQKVFQRYGQNEIHLSH